MVRTYKEDDYNLLSPWEKSMRNADADLPMGSGGIRTFNKKSLSPIVTFNDYNVLKLPPITEDPQQTIEFLGEEIGKCFLRSKRKLKVVKNEFVLYDPLGMGRIPKTSAYEILKRYKLPPNDNYQRKILAFFVTDNEPGKIDRVKLIDFFENSTLQYRKFVETKAKEDDRLKPIDRKIDSTYGRYDGEKSYSNRDPSISPRRGEAVSRQFADRRDVGLSLEIERAFKLSGMDPHDVIDRLEMSIQRTALNVRQRELKLVNNMHLKGLVAKHDFPTNAALTMKCIERLDTYGNGEIEWPKFIDFLRKAVCSIPASRDTRSPMSVVTSISSATISSGKAPWEMKKPLGSIKQNGGEYPEPHARADIPSIRVESTVVPPLQGFLHVDPLQSNSYSNGSSEDFLNNNNNVNQSLNTNSFSFRDSFEHVHPTLDNSQDRNGESDNQPGLFDEPSYDEKEEKLQKLSARGEVYKRVADALNDRAMLNNGLISTNDVRKTVNYYNMLFDADINLEKIVSKLDKHSKSDYVNVDLIIDSFSKGVV